MMENQSLNRLHIVLLAVFCVVFVWSAYEPRDRFTWSLEVFPAILGVGILLYVYPRFRFTTLVYVLVLIHCIILMVGGKYTYAQNPLFEYFKEIFGWTRNNYDKLGHIIQGVSPALIAREIFIRRRVVNGGGWTFFMAVAVPLAFAALYEIIEWLMAAINGEKVEAFLGTQGYFWDTQTDMFACLVASMAALVLLGGWHDAQMRNLQESEKA
jgi:putative membrane protein